MGTRGSFPGCQADHCPPSSADVKNVWSYTSIPPICLHGVVLSCSTGINLPSTMLFTLSFKIITFHLIYYY